MSVAHRRADTAMTAAARLVGLPLGPGRDPVAAAELLGLPRPGRLERVRGQDVRDAVQLAAEHAGQVGVPGVRVQQVGRRRPRRAARPSRGRCPSVCSAGLAPASAGRRRVGGARRPRRAARPSSARRRRSGAAVRGPGTRRGRRRRRRPRAGTPGSARRRAWRSDPNGPAAIPSDRDVERRRRGVMRCDGRASNALG